MATANPWKQFQSLLPKVSRTIGTVFQLNDNGTSTVTLRNGGTLTVKDQGVNAGHQVLIERGEIVQEVPALPVYSVQV